MSQFGLHRLRDGDELICRIQTDLGVETPYLLCAPVVRRADWGPPVPILHVPLDLEDGGHLILMTQMVALPLSVLGPSIGSAEAVRDQILRAVDLLVIGF